MHSNECPRGFKWCKEREECIPIRSDVDDKLTMRHQRYFFKGDGAMDQNVKYASELVDIAFDEGFDTFTKLKIAEGEMERLLDMCGKKHTTECGDMSEDSEEMDGEEYIEKPPITGDNDIDHVPNQHVGTLYNSIRKQLGEFRNLTLEGQEEYRAYFKSMLKKFGVTSPAQLDDQKKKQFFAAVSKGWKGVKESMRFESALKQLHESAMSYMQEDDSVVINIVRSSFKQAEDETDYDESATRCKGQVGFFGAFKEKKRLEYAECMLRAEVRFAKKRVAILKASFPKCKKNKVCITHLQSYLYGQEQYARRTAKKLEQVQQYIKNK